MSADRLLVSFRLDKASLVTVHNNRRIVFEAREMSMARAAARTPTPTAADDDPMEVDDEQPVVRLKTSDGKRFVLTKSQAFCSNALRTMIESSQNNLHSPNADYINLQSVNGQMLSMVVEWTRWHGAASGASTGDNQDSPSDSEGAGVGDNSGATYPKESLDYELTERDKTFLNSMSELELLKLTHVANYLDVPTLFSACCQTMARRWEGKRVAEIRQMYDIVGDFSCDEEEKMMAESKRFGMTD